jgi:hypothetical protein
MYQPCKDRINQWNSSGSSLHTGISPSTYYCELIVSCQVDSFSSMLKTGHFDSYLTDAYCT